MKRWITPLLLGLAVAASALIVVVTKHGNRQLVSELETLRTQRAQLDNEWSQLRLEEGALAHPGQVEQQAQQSLDMHEPDATVPLEMRK